MVRTQWLIFKGILLTTGFKYFCIFINLPHSVLPSNKRIKIILICVGNREQCYVSTISRSQVGSQAAIETTCFYRGELLLLPAAARLSCSADPSSSQSCFTVFPLTSSTH